MCFYCVVPSEEREEMLERTCALFRTESVGTVSGAFTAVLESSPELHLPMNYVFLKES